MKKTLLFVTRLLVSGALLYLIVSRIDWSQLRVPSGQGRLLYLLMGVVFGIAFNLVKFRKWYNLIRAGSPGPSYRDGAKSYMIGNALGLVTPMRAGDLGRALYFSPNDRPRILGLTIIDRLVDLVTVLILSIWGGFVLVSKGLGVSLAALSVLGLLLLCAPWTVRRILGRVVPSGFASTKVGKLSAAVEALNLKVVAVAVGLSFVAFFLVIVELYCLVSAFEGIQLSSMLLAAPLITLSSVIPVTVMGLGVREGLSIVLLSTFGISGASALSAAFLSFIINNASIGVIGAICLSRVRLTGEKPRSTPQCCAHSSGALGKSAEFSEDLVK